MMAWIVQTCVLVFICSIEVTHTITLPWGPSVISRAGRASPSDSWTTDCCPKGLKSEISSTGIDLVQYIYCNKDCCTGLEEEIVFREDGTEYTYCRDMEPELNDVMKTEISNMSLDKLYQLVRLMLKEST